MGLIVCITGGTAAGKSALSEHLCAKFKLPQFDPGGYQRKKFASLGFGSPAEYHKQLGLEKTYYGLWPEFIEQIRASIAKQGIVIGGVYTPEFLELVKQEFPEYRTCLLNVTATRHVRLRRFQLREKLEMRKAKHEFQALEESKQEVGLLRLLRGSDVIIKNQTTFQKFSELGERELLKLRNGDEPHAR
jgi:dephospho-CoA kinase